MAFKSWVMDRADGRKAFYATEDGLIYEMVQKVTAKDFTEEELLRMKLDAMSKFDWVRARDDR